MERNTKTESHSSVVKFQNLAVGYGSRPLHRPFSFSLEEGQFISLIGANGSGKSTILKTLIGEIPPVSGKIFLNNRDLLDYSAKERSCVMSALLTVSIKPELLTCRDVVAGGRYPYTGHFGLLTDEDNAKIDEVISLVKAEKFASQDFMKVSDGQKQRILIARALAQNPRVLVLDEPTSYLDIRWRLELLSVLKDLCKNGVTVISSLHELDLALKVSDRILCVGEDEVSELSRDESECKKQICNLYELGGDFFDNEKSYSELVRKFCEKKGVIGAQASPGIGQNSACEADHLHCRPLMIQGTMSNAGKSFIVAGLCRIFKQDGLSVAPFKSQNMALNSFVTKEGLEMGRAQVMQAEAAGLEPSVLMNPILLKPVSDVGSQVIVNGKAIGNMRAKDYFAFKKSLVPQIKDAFDKLASSHDVIVIEGAGSPAEINLKENDIVNMGMAKIADSPVLLVADIDRGGVFAQLVGTIELLEPEERARIKGLVINKFRGDKSILDSGIKMLEEKTGIPVVGTVPYVKIRLDDEDSLSENLHSLAKFRNKNNEIQLAIVRLPHISNFTDFNPLQNLDAVNSYYVQKPEDLGFPDCIIIPGTKNTLGDLKWLNDSGFADLIQKEAAKGTPVLGICGGFQMLGERLSGSEAEYENPSSAKKITEGLGLLPVETEFSSEKALTRVNGKVKNLHCDGGDESIFAPLSHFSVSGYEIHQGRTKFSEEFEKSSASGADSSVSCFAQVIDSVSGEEKLDGAVKGNVFGTYLHGLFDELEFTAQFVKILAKRKGFKWAGLKKSDGKSVQNDSDSSKKSQIFNAEAEIPGNIQEFKESQYNLLADTLRQHLDMKKIYEMISK
ncbi:cobyric acid synthase [uncultured Treponema sp.]|uniref:cobyric acid synthase n=1 Tax=uncultured Treponema sp. TaxID=162155 RepID=UPI002600CA77|nr:cobyric acid synthase [uncultured Treponema sp.]